MKQIFAALFTLALSLPSLAQRLDIGIGYGYTRITAPERYVNPVSNLGYGFSEANPILATIRLTSADNPMSFSLSTVYQELTGRGGVMVLSGLSSDLPPGEIENRCSLWSVAIGTDWTTVKSNRAPHLLLELLFSSMGDLSITTGTPEGDHHYFRTGSIQAGIAFGGGFNFPLVFGTAIRLDAKYLSYGIFGRPVGEKSVTSAQLTGTFTIPIWSSQGEQSKRAP